MPSSNMAGSAQAAAAHNSLRERRLRFTALTRLRLLVLTLEDRLGGILVGLAVILF
jgi:hypothetical protein